MGSSKFKLTWNGDKTRAELRRAAEAAVTAGALIAEGQIKALTPVKDGALRDSVTHNDPLVRGDRLIIEVGSALDYALYQEFGTGEFAENGAGRKGGWVYRDADGTGRFTRGNRPQRMFRNGFRRARPRIINAIERRLGSVGQ